MYARTTALMLLLGSVTAAAQTPAAGGHDQHAGHNMPQGTGDIPATREGSGTAWLPDESPMHAVHGQAGDWMLMGHGSVFLQYLIDGGDRGQEQAGSINWFMGTAQRRAGAGRFILRGMASLEPWTIRGCGYPDLLATGEECDGEPIHDRQHPHDVFMELAAQYERPLGRGTHLQLYGGLAGEPALGPVAFMHRVSAVPNPIAPISHHWFDSTHITFGVVTAGVFSRRWKVEGSAFNGREPDEHRGDLDLAALDSWSGRLWYMPTSRWALQVSAGRLNDVHAGHDPDAPPVDVGRVTASATYHRTTLENVTWATTVGWGRNSEDGEGTNALLLESSVSVRERDVVYGRYEVAQKDHDELVVDGPGFFTVSKLQAGYTRYGWDWKQFTAGAGAAATMSIVPPALRPAYGSRVNPGLAVYLTIRPRAQQ